MYLYIIECKEPLRDLYKIGITNDLEKRLKNIKTGNPYPVKFVFQQERNDASKIERWLHSQFNDNRMEGEWFHSLSVEEIRKKIFMFNDILL